MSPRPLGQKTMRETMRARQQYLAPLFVYLRAHRYTASLVAHEASERGGYPFTAVRVWQMKRGTSVTPPWFVEQCCAVIEKSVAEVMGSRWVARFGEDGRGLPSGGTEEAPVGEPRIQKPPNRPAHYQRRQGANHRNHHPVKDGQAA